MKIIIIGAGKMGTAITRELANEGHDITVVDNIAESVATVSDMYDVITLEGSGTDFAVLRECGVGDADLLIACSGSDEVNLICCAAAQALGCKNAVARLKEPIYTEEGELLHRGFGISDTVNPDLEAAEEIARILQFPSAARVETFARGRAELVEYLVTEESGLDGLSLKELPARYRVRVLVCAAERGDEVFIPNGNFVLRVGDRLNIAGERRELQRFFAAVGAYKKPVKSVMLLGGSRIAVYLARQLQDMDVTIIEKDRARCERLCELLPEVTVICGDGSRQEVLLEEGIRTVDAFVSMTGFDEDNIILSMYAQKCGVGRVITKVSDSHFVSMLQGTGLDSFVCPKLLAAGELTQFVRAMGDAVESKVETLYRLFDNRMEALEFVVDDSFRAVGAPLKELKLQSNVLLGGIIRGREFIIPNGASVMKKGDRVLVVTTRSGLTDLNEILE